MRICARHGPLHFGRPPSRSPDGGADPFGGGPETNDESMKAAIIGYGKMGREIERILRERGDEVALIIDAVNRQDLDAAHLAVIDVALVFTTPATAYDNIRTCL